MVTGLGPGPEFDLIRRFLATRAPREGSRPDPRSAKGIRVGPGDDCAVVAGEGIAVTVDMAVEDVHFRRAWLSPEEIGWRTASAALSDLAAMAARPIGILASVALAEGDAGDSRNGEALMRGIAAAAEDVGADLIGGDLVRSSGPLVVDIVALGEAPRPVLRSGARPGHELWVTGSLGGAAAAVEAWLRGDEPGPRAREAFAHPKPRIAEALWLGGRDVPTAMIDLSDGLAGDAGHIAAASGVRVIIEAAALPISPAVPSGDPAERLRLAAAGGEDYELCFATAPGAAGAVAAEFAERFGIGLTRVGRIEEGEGAVVVDEAGQPIPLRAYQHWGEQA